MSSHKQRAVFISDTHLGTRDAQSEYLLDFLRNTECDYLYLLGDIIDIWKLRSGWHWPPINNDLLQLVFKKARTGTRVIYIPGNHDEMLRKYAGSNFNGIQIQLNAVHETADGRRLLLIHGDEFDSVVASNQWQCRGKRLMSLTAVLPVGESLISQPSRWASTDAPPVHADCKAALPNNAAY